MKKRNTLFILILIVLLTACAAKAAEAPMQDKMAEPGLSLPEVPSLMEFEYAEEAMAIESNAHERTASGGEGFADTTGSTIERMVIKNANLSIVVKDPSQALDTINQMADEMGGFVVNSYLYKTYTDNGIEVPEVDITIRVPAEDLNEALDEIKSLVDDQEKDILSENISGQDVTKEFTDLKSRLKNLEQAEEQLQEIMGSATETEDVLTVFNELTSVREQIEVIQGEINYYEESSRLSSISVNIMAQEAVKPLTIGKWEPAGVARDAVQALIGAVKFFINVAIWVFLFLLPIALIFAIPIWLIVVFIRSRIRIKKQKAAGIKKASSKPQEPLAKKTE